MAFVVSLSFHSLFAQDIVLKGMIYDAKTKEPIYGASIAVSGTTLGTITNDKGEFQLSVPKGSANIHLVISYIGYKSQNIILKGQKSINIALEEDSKLINEVVVVGYATQKKESVVGAISSIDNSAIVSLPVSNVTQALAGKLPGVAVVQSSGEVGRDEASVYIRGLATYGVATPLIVVDGIVRESFAQIDPNEIKSINILKDASATAVYGVKGANGVIIITTRRGEEGKPKISFSAQYAITQPVRVPDPLGSYDAAILKNVQNQANDLVDAYSPLDIIKYRTGASPYTHPDVHWMDEVMKDFSSMQQYNVNITGGNKFIKYFVSGGTLGQDGFYKHDPYTNFTRYNFRSNLDFNITKKLTASFNLGARIEKRTYPGNSRDNSWNIYRGAFATGGRTEPVYNPDGSLAGTSSQTNLIGVISEGGVYKETKSVVEMGLNVKYDLSSILNGLSARAQLAFDNTGTNGKYFTQGFAVYDYNLATDTYTQVGEDSELSYGWANNWFDQKVYAEAGLEYNKSFGLNSITGLLLANRGKREIVYYSPYAEQGIVARVTYDYNRRYFGEVNACYNGSENFAKGNRYGLFPSFAAGWLVSNEDFIAESSLADILTHLKLRGSLGWVGNDKSGDVTRSDYQSDRFMYIQQYVSGGGAYFGSGDNWFSGIYQESIANKDVTWEVGMKSDIGIESNFWGDLIGLNLDLFYEKRSNILTDISSITPDYVGATFMDANVGVVQNKGIEIELSHQYKIGRDFNYSIKGHYSFTRNKVISEADADGTLAYQKAAGYSIGTPNVYKVIGVFQDYEDIYNSPTQLTISGNTEVKPGDLKYLDFNGDGQIDDADSFRQGYGTVPEIEYGVTFSCNYKNFDFSVLFQGTAHSNFAKNWEIMWPFSNANNVYSRHWMYWTPEISGSESFIRIYGPYQNNEPSPNGSTYSLGSGDYLRLKNLEIGYSLPKSIISKVKMSGARVYFSGNNLFLWAAEPYLDPDNRDQRGGVMPQTRAFNFGLNVNF